MNGKKESNRVSVIIPCFNGEQYLRQCFECLLNQTYNNVEVVIVDDGSTDNTETIIWAYKELFSQRGYRYIPLKQNNAGAAAAVQNALNYITGDYLMLYDVDDIIARDNIKAKADFLTENPEYGLVRNNGYYVKAKNKCQNSYLFIWSKKEKENEHIFEDILFARTNNWAGSYMVRVCDFKEATIGSTIFVSRWGQNLQIIMPVAFNSRCGFIDKPLMRYVDYKGSVSRPNTIKEELRMINGYRENRVETLKRINMAESKRKAYIDKIDILYSRVRLVFAAQHNQYDIAKENYDYLKEHNQRKASDIYYLILAKIELLGIIHFKILWVMKMTWCVFKKCEGKWLRHDGLY